MSPQILNEHEFKERLAFWLLDNDIGACIPYGGTREDFAQSYRLPDFDYIHTQSFADENGDLITLLKSGVSLKEWESRSGKACSFEFYHVLKTLTDSPEVEPFPMGYIIVFN